MYQKLPVFILIVIAIAVEFSGCSSNTFGSFKNEGRIVYEVVIENEDIDPITLSMMPTEAEFYFTEDKSALFISSTGNFFRFSMIADNTKKIVIQELKIMNKKVKAVFNDRDIFYYQDHPGFTIIETNYTDTIVGFTGDVSLIIFDDVSSREFPIVHTDEIKLKNPNWYSLYKEIPAVLLQYEYVQFGLKFKLRAKSIEFFDVDEILFEADLEYIDITPEDLMDELRKLADTM